MKKTEKLRGELHKSEVFLIASPLLVVKAENIYIGTQSKCTKPWKQSSAIKQLLNSLSNHSTALKPVHIFMARNKVSKSCLMAELSFHRFVHFDCVPIYIFGFHHKQCASD